MYRIHHRRGYGLCPGFTTGSNTTGRDSTPPLRQKGERPAHSSRTICNAGGARGKMARMRGREDPPPGGWRGRERGKTLTRPAWQKWRGCECGKTRPGKKSAATGCPGTRDPGKRALRRSALEPGTREKERCDGVPWNPGPGKRALRRGALEPGTREKERHDECPRTRDREKGRRDGVPWNPGPGKKARRRRAPKPGTGKKGAATGCPGTRGPGKRALRRSALEPGDREKGRHGECP